MSSKQSQVCCVVIHVSAVCVPVAVVGGRLQSSRVDVRPRRVEVSDERAPAGRVQQQPITAQLTRAATTRHVQLLYTSQTTSSQPTPAKYCDERVGLYVCLCVCPRTVLFCSLAVLDPRVGHTMDVLSPFIPVFCHSD